MLNLESIPAHIREWAEKDLLPVLENLRSTAEAAAQKGVADAQRYLKLAQSLVSAADPEAQAIIADAEKGLAEAEALLKKVLGG